MSLVISDDILHLVRMSEMQLKREFALWLFQQQRFTLAQAARFLGATRLEFQKMLADRHIPVHYEVADLEQDLDTLAVIKL